MQNRVIAPLFLQIKTAMHMKPGQERKKSLTFIFVRCLNRRDTYLNFHFLSQYSLIILSTK